MFYIVIAFIQITAPLSLSEIQKHYKERKHFTLDSIKEFTLLFRKYVDYRDLKNLILYDKYSGFESKNFKLWASFEDAIFYGNSKLFLKTLDNLRNHYISRDKVFLIKYYELFYKMAFGDALNADTIFTFCRKYENKYSFISSLLHEYLYQLSTRQKFNQNYLKAVLAKIKSDENLSVFFLNKAYIYFLRFLRAKGSYEFVRLFLNHAKDNMSFFGEKGYRIRNDLITDLMELNFERKNYSKNKGLVKELRLNLLQEYEMMYVNIFLGNIEKINTGSIKDINIKYYLEYLIAINKLERRESFLNRELPSFLKHKGKYKERFERALISYYSLKGMEQKSDSLFNKYKDYFLKEIYDKSIQFLNTDKVFSSSAVINYINSYRNPELSVAHLLKFHRVIRKGKLKKKYLYKNVKLRLVLRKMDTNLSLNDFVDLASIIYLNNDVKVETVVNQDSLLLNTSLEEKEILVIYIKGSDETRIYTLNHLNEVKRFLMGNRKELLSYLNNYEKIRLCDNQNLISKNFVKDYLELNNRIPNLQFVSNITTNNSIKKYEVKSASFFGTDKPFNYEKKYYPSLFYIKKEPEIISDYVTIKNYYNSPENNFELKSDFVQLSGHFIESDKHPLFHKIAIGKNDTSLVYLAPYDFAFNKEVSSKIVFLNSCYSAKSISYDNFSGQQQYSKYLLEAGVKSVIVAKKDIDDKMAVIFLERFLKSLDNGFYLSEAIQASKTYIKDNINSDPKFWDVYELYGEDFKVQFVSKSLYYYSAIFILLLIFSLFYKKVVTK